MKIKITAGSVSPGDAKQYHLVTNHLLDQSMNADKVIMYAEQRYLMTLLTSGARDSRYTVPGYTPSKGSKDTVATRVPMVPKGELINGNSWKYKIKGRIQKADVIVGTSAVGTPTGATSTKGGSFKLRLMNNFLSPGMVCTFASGDQARIMALPTGSRGNYLYTFECFPGEAFTWATWVAVQNGEKTVFGGYTSFGERSRRGYGYFTYPDEYIQHTTIQRKSISLSGTVNTHKVFWYELNGQKGFSYEAEAESRTQFLLEDEFQKWWGRSSMRDEFGNLLARSSMYDEKGDEIVQGDGWYHQVKGSNDVESSGTNGDASYDDFSDAIRAAKKHRNKVSGNESVVVTGSDGMDIAHRAAMTQFSAASPLTQIEKPGTDITQGYRITRLYISGEWITFVENPMMDDEERFPSKLSNGKLRMSATFYGLDLSMDNQGKNNMEVRTSGREGVNRNMVYGWFEGMTGGVNKPDNPIDAKEFHILKEDMLCLYNSKTSFVISPPATA